MDSIDMDILKVMSKRDKYYELRDIIDKSLCVKESWTLVRDFGEYFKQHKTEQEITPEFKAWQRVIRHPGWKPDEAKVWGQIVDNVLSRPYPDGETFNEALNHIRVQSLYARLASELSTGATTADDAEMEVRKFGSALGAGTSTLAPLTLDELANTARSGGYYWRVEDFNRSIGPLRKGDFCIVAKRPEVGGTSFLVSEMSHMLEQTKGNAIIFNNEEEPSKVFSRMVSSALDLDYRSLLGDPVKHQAMYDAWLDGSEWDLCHDTNMTVASIHQKLEDKQYDLIGINVLLKIGGTGKAEDHDKFQELGEECRRIAQKYGPVIAIVQADPSAEGMQFIPQDRIYKSKTALQGEADCLIMLGTDDPIVDHRRYAHVAKNKIPPADCTVSKEKHIKCEVAFDIDSGRFSSVNYTTNSRDTSK
jgi:hypothetical protein